MFTDSLRQLLPAGTLLMVVSCAALTANVAAQTTQPTPPPSNPVQRDATRTPGTQQRQTIPDQARPVTPNPATPPGTVRPAPAAPPGTTITAQPTPPVTNTTVTTPTTTTTTPITSPTPLDSNTVTTDTNTQEIREPVFPDRVARPMPPLPILTRVGIITDNTLTLTLNEAIRRALENNNDIEVARNDVRFAETTLRALNGIYDPVFNFTPQLNNIVESQQSTLGGSDTSGTVTQTNLTFDNSATKFFSTGGGRYETFFNNTRRTTNSTFNRLNPVYSSSLGVTFTQPLLRDRSIDSNRRNIRIQRKRLEQSDADFRRRTIDVIAQVQRAYWDLVFALRDQQNRLANLNLSRESLRRVEAQIAAGSIAPLERAEVQTELANRESDLLLASQNISVAENNLKALTLRDPLSQEWMAQIVPTDAPSTEATPVNLNDAMEEARTNRPELRRLHLQRDINDIDLQFYKNQTRPRIDIQSTLATTGLAGTPVIASGAFSDGTAIPPGTPDGQVPIIFGDPNTNANAFLLGQINQIRALQGLPAAIIPVVTPQTSTVPENLVGGYRRDLRNLFGFGTRNVVVGVAIQIPFRNRTAEADLAGARIQRTQLEASTRLQEQSVIVEVRNAVQSVETARQRVIAARAARENAELQLAGERRLYQAGRSTTFLLFQRENQLANARNLELRAETDYNIALADLQRATSTTLRANNVIVETPTVP